MRKWRNLERSHACVKYKVLNIKMEKRDSTIWKGVNHKGSPLSGVRGGKQQCRQKRTGEGVASYKWTFFSEKMFSREERAFTVILVPFSI